MTDVPQMVAPVDLSDLVDDHTDDLAAIAADPGSELVCLPDDLALGELDSDYQADNLALLAAPFVPEPLTASKAISWTEYEWSTWLPDVLRAAGVPVIVHPGYGTRGRPRSTGRYQPRGVLWHHDGSRKGPSPYVAKFLAETGRPAEGIPAPLSQCWVCLGCNGQHSAGTWHVLAAGRCNHAGTGHGFRAIPADTGNAACIGVETDNTVNEPTPPAMYASLVRGTAAIMRRLRANPAGQLAGHKEYTDRKNDPDDIDMARARLTVAAEMARQAHPTPAKPPVQPAKPPAKPPVVIPPPALVPYPGSVAFRLGRKHKAVTLLDGWLIAAGFAKHNDPKRPGGYKAGPRFTEWTRLNVADFQRSEPALDGDPDGFPGPVTWRLLQERAHVHRLEGHPVGK